MFRSPAPARSRSWLTFSLALGLLATAAFASARQATAQAGGNQQEAKAIELLRRSMGRKFPVNVVAVILQRDPSSDGSFQRVKVTRSRDGRTRHTVLQPLRMAGVESVDDGELMRVLLPDRRAIILQDSPHRVASDTDERMVLARQNYTFTITPGERIAGRDTVCVVAQPRAAELAVRRYYLDDKNGYPLKMEVVNGKTAPQVMVHTIAIDYPESLTAHVFELAALNGMRTIRYSRPQTLTDPSQALSVVGFRPTLPSRLPLGFKVQEMQVSSGDEWKSVVIRLTDGLARATVYQYRSDGRRVDAIEESSSMDSNGVRYLLVSDLLPAVRNKLLAAFASRALNDDTPRAQRLVGARATTPQRPVLRLTREPSAQSRPFVRVSTRARSPLPSPIVR